MAKVERIIVPPAPEQEAKHALRRWRAKYPELWSKLGEDDVIVDLVRSDGGKTRWRYRIFVDPEDVAWLDGSE